MILIDTSEPEFIRQLIAQSSETVTTPLNQHDIADYMFSSADKRTVQLERKQARELLGDIDNCERELRDYYNSCNKTYLLVEGIISPFRIEGAKRFKEISIRQHHTGQLYAYSVDNSGNIKVESTMSGVSHAQLRSWYLQLDILGISQIHTINEMDTAITIVSMYNNLQKTEHSTLQRYFRPRIQLKDLNPHVQAMMNLSAAYKWGVGEVKAKAIVNEFSNLLNVMIADTDELAKVPGVGIPIAEKILESIRREFND